MFLPIVLVVLGMLIFLVGLLTPVRNLYTFLISIIIIISGVFSLLYRKKEKLDTGFALFYYKLSYRRKMIRTLWSIPIIIICLIIIFLTPAWNFQLRLIIISLLLLSFLLQLAYNYYMWKKHETNE